MTSIRQLFIKLSLYLSCPMKVWHLFFIPFFILICENGRKQDAQDKRHYIKIKSTCFDLEIIFISLLFVFTHSIQAQPRPWMPPAGLEISVIGTGNTTGHILTLFAENGSLEPLDIQSQIFYIPSNGKDQSYIGEIDGPILIPVGSKVKIPINGYCTDVTLPPVGSGELAPDILSWIPIFGTSELNEEGSTDQDATSIYEAEPMKPVDLVFANPISAFTIADIPKLVSSEITYLRKTKIQGVSITWPGTNDPIPVIINQTEAPELFASVVATMKENIEVTYDSLAAQGAIITPFSSNRPKERESIIQQIIWIFTSQLDGIQYDNADFKQKMEEQFEEITGQGLQSAPSKVIEGFYAGVADFWDSFTIVGVEAKVISVEPQSSDFPPTKKMSEGFGGTDISEVKPYVGSPAEEASEHLDAGGIAKGSKIELGPGRDPIRGDGTLAEEVVHTDRNDPGNPKLKTDDISPIGNKEADKIEKALDKLSSNKPKEKCLSGNIQTTFDPLMSEFSGVLMQLPDGTDMDEYLIKSGQIIPDGSILKTSNSELVIHFLECDQQKWVLNSQLIVSPDSELTISHNKPSLTSVSSIDIGMLSGEMIFKTTSEKDANNSLAISTFAFEALATAATFLVASNMDSDIVVVLEGCVQIKDLKDSLPLNVCAGRQWQRSNR